jgi:hypothetical protein
LFAKPTSHRIFKPSVLHASDKHSSSGAMILAELSWTDSRDNSDMILPCHSRKRMVLKCIAGDVMGALLSASAIMSFHDSWHGSYSLLRALFPHSDSTGTKTEKSSRHVNHTRPNVLRVE